MTIELTESHNNNNNNIYLFFATSNVVHLCDIIHLFLKYIISINEITRIRLNSTSHKMGEERSAGFLIFRRANSQIEYMLLKASEMDKNWTPPKGTYLCDLIQYFNSIQSSFINLSLNSIGHVDSGEDDITAALRETREEAGYVTGDLHIYKEHFKILNYKVGDNDKSVIYWLAELKEPEKKPKLSHEHTEHRWLNKDDAILLNGFDDFAEMINYFHDKINSV